MIDAAREKISESWGIL